MNAEELKQHNEYLAELDKIEKKVAADAAAKQALLAKIGITTDEANLLLS